MDEHRYIVVLITDVSGSGKLEIFTAHRFLSCPLTWEPLRLVSRGPGIRVGM
jgi:hypothetical protein